MLRCQRRQSGVAATTGLTTARFLKWANMADLMCTSGIGSEFSELLEAVGVDTVKELRNLAARTILLPRWPK